jgi:hypothetical protein
VFKIAKVTFLLYHRMGCSRKKLWNNDSKNQLLKAKRSWGQNGSDANLAGNGDIQVYKTVDGVASVVYEGVSG